MSAPAIPQGDRSERIVAAVRDAEKRVTFNNLAELVKAKGEPLRAALESAVDTGRVHRWPNRGQSQYFWRLPLELKAREAILTVAAAQALSKPNLSKLAAKGKKLPGFSAKRVEGVVSALVADKQLPAVPAFPRRGNLLVRARDHAAYST